MVKGKTVTRYQHRGKRENRQLPGIVIRVKSKADSYQFVVVVVDWLLMPHTGRKWRLVGEGDETRVHTGSGHCHASDVHTHLT